MLAADFTDCVMPEASPVDRPKLEMYGQLRRKHSTFQKRSLTHNNHRDVVQKFNRWLADYDADERRTCEMCGTPLPTLARSNTRFCSKRCRQRAAYRQKVA
jgi:hypothetical protein